VGKPVQETQYKASSNAVELFSGSES